MTPALHDGATFRQSVLAALDEPRTVAEIVKRWQSRYTLETSDLVVEALLALRDCGLVEARVRQNDPDGCGSTEWRRR